MLGTVWVFLWHKIQDSAGCLHVWKLSWSLGHKGCKSFQVAPDVFCFYQTSRYTYQKTFDVKTNYLCKFLMMEFFFPRLTDVLSSDIATQFFQLMPNWDNVWLIISNNASLVDSLHVHISNSCGDILPLVGSKIRISRGFILMRTWLLLPSVDGENGRFFVSFTSFDLEWNNRLIVLKGNGKKYGKNIWLEISI